MLCQMLDIYTTGYIWLTIKTSILVILCSMYSLYLFKQWPVDIIGVWKKRISNFDDFF